jgi:hypothetical protein
VVVHVAGVYGPRTTALEPPTDAEFAQVMTPTCSADAGASALADVLAPGAKLALLSSRMGAIGPRTGPPGLAVPCLEGGRQFGAEGRVARAAGRCICVSVHPGWVRTEMGTDEADLSPEQSVADLRRLIAG